MTCGEIGEFGCTHTGRVIPERFSQCTADSQPPPQGYIHCKILPWSKTNTWGVCRSLSRILQYPQELVLSVGPSDGSDQSAHTSSRGVRAQ
mmetsp:Transcript_22191/g.30520  ORF Transcript_22191/g.30520 Transcript_22191/m.30520 type:complete len:91 (-) Transcript_22191:193-465(-)